jgi:nicotinate-nucleotide adenylyltransferase
MIVGIFGGTFDPPHKGHLGLAEIVLHSKACDEIWFVPCLSHRFGKQPAPFQDRIAMCRLLIEDQPHMKVDEIESKLERPGYTFDLVNELLAAHPENSFRVLAGADIYFERDKWHRYDEIARLAPPLYIGRTGVGPISEPTLEAPIEASSTDIRAVIGDGGRPKNLMSRRVLDYISVRGLYQEGS